MQAVLDCKPHLNIGYLSSKIHSRASSVPSKLKKTSIFGTFFGCQLTKILKIGTCIFWTQFSSLEKISQNTI